MTQTTSVLEVVQGEAAAFEAAEVEFEKQLVRVYGKRTAPQARYRRHYADKAVQHARDAFVAAADVWRSSVRQARQRLVVSEHCDG